MIDPVEVPDREALIEEAAAVRRRIRILQCSLQLLPGTGYLVNQIVKDFVASQGRLDQIFAGLAVLSDLATAREPSGAVSVGLRS